MKTIVTHFNPDMDAICAVWLLKRFMPGFEDAEVKFVPIGETLDSKPVDSNPEVVHVDTGYGKFDHHQDNEYTCAAKKVFDTLPEKTEALERLVRVVVEIDQGKGNLWPEAAEDRAEFSLTAVLYHFRARHQDYKIQLEWGLDVLDNVYEAFKRKTSAEKILNEGSIKFETVWGKSIGAVSDNESFIDLSLAKGFVLAARKDPKKGHIRIYSRADSKVDLTKQYEEFKKLDPEATWFLHASKKLLLNGSTSSLTMRPTKLGLEEIIKVLEGA